ncbi:hypothetical protein ACFO9Q_15205 [Paenibacillus sp. GCM10023252]|uniref:hypothetical protein n=1 Tax=Paenibacillus sp. GCM10023252 TaxID=3252649 RepID=UPI0036087F19
MRRFASLHVMLYLLFIVSTIAAITLAYLGIGDGQSLAYKFLIGYLFFSIAYALYITCALVYHMSKLRWAEMRKRLYTFVKWFIYLSIPLIIIKLIFSPEDLDLSTMSTPFGLSIAISFFDLLWGKREIEED